MRALVKLLLVVMLGCAALPAAAADVKFPAPIEAAFADAKAAMMEDPALVLRHVATAEELARKLPDARQRALALATARWLAGEARLRSNEPEAAGRLLAEGLKLIEPIKETIKLRGDLLMSQGAYFMQRDEAALALSSFQRACKIFQELKEARSEAIALQNIGALYSGANDAKSAAKYYQQASDAFSGDPMLSLSLHNSRGNVLLVLERYDEAEAEYQKALDIARSLGKPLLEARLLGNLARAQVEAGELDIAERTLAQGFALARGEDARPVVFGLELDRVASDQRIACVA